MTKDVFENAANMQAKPFLIPEYRRPNLIYSEMIEKGSFVIRLFHPDDNQKCIIASFPNKEIESYKEECRTYFLSLVFDSAINGVSYLPSNNNH